MDKKYQLRPNIYNSDGNVRRVGIEIEFAGLRIERITSTLQDLLDGNLRLVSAYEHLLRDTKYGDFRIELDYNFLLAIGREETGIDLPDSLSDLKDLSEDLVSAVARMFVPFEIVTPPLPMNELDWMNDLCSRLRKAGALGTRSSLLYGFGLHMNPELPSLDDETVLRYFKGFLVCYAWLKERDETDLTRQLTPHIQPFSRDYLRKTLKADYQPKLPQLIDDYLDANPTRNRAMDMLPLFMHLDPDRVNARVADVLIKQRPTLHYRLPNCQIDEEDWSFSDAWNDWVVVEELINDPERLDEMCAACVRYLANPVAGLFGDWAERSEQWLGDPASA